MKERIATALVPLFVVLVLLWMWHHRERKVEPWTRTIVHIDVRPEDVDRPETWHAVNVWICKADGICTLCETDACRASTADWFRKPIREFHEDNPFVYECTLDGINWTEVNLQGSLDGTRACRVRRTR